METDTRSVDSSGRVGQSFDRNGWVALSGRSIASLPLSDVCLVMTIRVLTADDHAVVRAGVAALIAKEPDLELCAEAKDGAEAVRLYEMHQPDVVLMHLRMPGIDAVAALPAIVPAHPGARAPALPRL